MTPKQRTKCRDFCGVATTTSIPVELIKGYYEPLMVGEAGGHFTKAGVPIRHPMAYGGKGLSNMVYKTSTRKIVVGQDWVEQNTP